MTQSSTRLLSKYFAIKCNKGWWTSRFFLLLCIRVWMHKFKTACSPKTRRGSYPQGYKQGFKLQFFFINLLSFPQFNPVHSFHPLAKVAGRLVLLLWRLHSIWQSLLLAAKMSSSPTLKVENVHFGFVNQELELQCTALVDELGQNYSALKNEWIYGRGCKSWEGTTLRSWRGQVPFKWQQFSVPHRVSASLQQDIWNESCPHPLHSEYPVFPVSSYKQD